MEIGGRAATEMQSEDIVTGTGTKGRICPHGMSVFKGFEHLKKEATWCSENMDTGSNLF